MKIVILSWYPTYHNRHLLSLKSQLPQHPYPWVFNLAKGLTKYDNNVHIISFNRELVNDQTITVDNVTIHYLKPTDSRVIKYINNFSKEKQKLFKLVEEIKPDIIHGQSIEFPANESVNLPYPSVITLHGLAEDFFQLAKGINKLKLYNLIQKEKYVLSKIKNIILISDYVEKALNNLNPNINKYKIYNSVSEVFFQHTASFSEKQILFIGNDAERKGLFDIVKAIENIPNVKLSIISTDQTGYYRNIILPYIKTNKLENRINYYQFMDNQQIPYEIAKSVCLVLPTKAETAPMIIGEANAVGVPVIATNVGGIPEMIINDETGFIIPLNDQKTLIDKISLLISNPNLSIKMGKKAKELAIKRYHPDSVAKQTLKVYQTILSL